MSTLAERLAAPFPIDELEWKFCTGTITSDGSKALALIYVTNRAIMNRLDEVFGSGGWRNEYQRWGAKGVLCGISAWMKATNDDADFMQWVTKWDGADDTDIEPTKGGLSDSMKRAAVQWGIGRYLYRMPDLWGPGKASQNGKGFRFDKGWIPPIPAEFLPAGSKAPAPAPAARPPAATPTTKAAPPKQPAPAQEVGSDAAAPGTSNVGWPVPEELRPPWASEKLGVGTGGGFPAFKNKPAREFTWNEMLAGDRDGSRVKYMRWAVEKAMRDEKRGVRPSDAESLFIDRCSQIVKLIDAGSPF